jgi:hypothetical protein
MDGLAVDDVTRNPRRAIARLARTPRTPMRLAANGGMIERVVESDTDRWEYARSGGGTT